VQTVRLGTKTSRPVVGYWNAGTTSDLGVWNGATATFVKRHTPTRTTTIRFGKPR